MRRVQHDAHPTAVHANRQFIRSTAAYVLILIGAAIASTELAGRLVVVVLPWRRPVQDWMISHGLGRWAAAYGLVNLHIPDFALALAGGALLGAIGGVRWLRLVLVYAAGYFVVPNLLTINVLLSSAHAHGGALVARVLVYQIISIFPGALAAGWLASRPARRRRERRRAGGLCESCGYDLRGNVSGRCPECGQPAPAPPPV